MTVYVEGMRRRDGGYTVRDAATNAEVGRVVAVPTPRIARATTDPWWQAVDNRGDAIGPIRAHLRDAARELDR